MKKMSIQRSMMIAASVFCLLAAVVKANEKPRGVNDDTTVSLSFNETPLPDVIKAFRDSTGVNIVSGGTNLSSIVVSMRLDNVPWKQGLTSILEPQNLQAVEQPTGSGIYVIVPKSTDIPRITRTFELLHAKAGDITNMLMRAFDPKSVTVASYAQANAIIITGSEKVIGECEHIIQVIDKAQQQVYIEARFMELTASASRQLGLKWDTLGGDGWGMTASDLGVSISDTKTSDKTSGSYVDKGTRETAGGTTTSSSSTTSGTGSSSTLGSSANTTTYNTYVPAGDILDNSVNRLKTRAITGQLTADKFRLALNAFEQMDGVSIFSNPKVIVANEQKAVVDMTTKEPYIKMSFQAAASDNGRDSVSSEIMTIPGDLFKGDSFFSYGITLEVTPRVSPTGLITVDIEPSISDLKGYTEIQGVDSGTAMVQYPIINFRRIKTIFTMNDGYTAVIGGLTRTSETSVDSGIPYLRKIPWLGDYLFGWKSRVKEQHEIVIFVTVGIANPLHMEEGVGLPRNSILGREILKKQRKEPGDQTREEFLNLDMRPVEKDTAESKAVKAATPASSPSAEGTKPAAEKGVAPAVPNDAARTPDGTQKPVTADEK